MATTPTHVNDLNMAGQLLHCDEEAAFGDVGYQGEHKRPEVAGPTWHVAMRPGLRRRLNPFIQPDFVAERVEKMKASIRAKVEHPFRVLKRQFGLTKAPPRDDFEPAAAHIGHGGGWIGVVGARIVVVRT